MSTWKPGPTRLSGVAAKLHAFVKNQGKVNMPTDELAAIIGADSGRTWNAITHLERQGLITARSSALGVRLYITSWGRRYAARA